MEPQSDMSSPARAFYTTNELALLLNTSPSAIRMALSRGGTNLPPRVKRGRKWIFPTLAYERWIAELSERAELESRPRRGRGRPRKIAA